MAFPTDTHWLVFKRLTKYINGTLNYGLQFPKNSYLDLITFNDVDWASYPDENKSTSAFCVFLSNNLVS